MTGKRTRLEDLFPPLPADHPLFKRGFVIGFKRSGGSSTSGTPPNAPPQKEELPSPMPAEPPGGAARELEQAHGGRIVPGREPPLSRWAANQKHYASASKQLNGIR